MSSKKRIDWAKEALVEVLYDGQWYSVVESISELIDAKIADYESRRGGK